MLPQLFLNDASTGIPTFQEPIGFPDQVANSQDLTDKFAVDIQMNSLIEDANASLVVMVNKKRGSLNNLNNEDSSTVVYNILHLAKFVWDVYETFESKDQIVSSDTKQEDLEDLKGVNAILKKYTRLIQVGKCPTMQDFCFRLHFSTFRDKVINDTFVAEGTRTQVEVVTLLNLKIKLKKCSDAWYLVKSFLTQDIAADGVSMHGKESEMYLRLPRTNYRYIVRPEGLNAQVEEEDEPEGVFLQENEEEEVMVMDTDSDGDEPFSDIDSEGDE